MGGFVVYIKRGCHLTLSRRAGSNQHLLHMVTHSPGNARYDIISITTPFSSNLVALKLRRKKSVAYHYLAQTPEKPLLTNHYQLNPEVLIGAIYELAPVCYTRRSSGTCLGWHFELSNMLSRCQFTTFAFPLSTVYAGFTCRVPVPAQGACERTYKIWGYLAL